LSHLVLVPIAVMPTTSSMAAVIAALKNLRFIALFLF